MAVGAFVGRHLFHILGRGELSTDTKRIRSDEGLTLEISALKLSMVANLRYQFS